MELHHITTEFDFPQTFPQSTFADYVPWVENCEDKVEKFDPIAPIPILKLNATHKNVDIKRFSYLSNDWSDASDSVATKFNVIGTLNNVTNDSRVTSGVNGSDTESSYMLPTEVRVLNEDDNIFSANRASGEFSNAFSENESDISSLSSVELLKDVQVPSQKPKINPFFVTKDSTIDKLRNLEKLKELIRKQRETNHFKESNDSEIYYEPPEKIIHKGEDHVKTTAEGSWFGESLSWKNRPMIRKSCQASEPLPYKGFSNTENSIKINGSHKNSQVPYHFTNISNEQRSKDRKPPKVRKLASRSSDEPKNSIITPSSWKEDKAHLKQFQEIKKYNINKKDTAHKKALDNEKKKTFSSCSVNLQKSIPETLLPKADKSKKVLSPTEEDGLGANVIPPNVTDPQKCTATDSDIPTFENILFQFSSDDLMKKDNVTLHDKVEDSKIKSADGKFTVKRSKIIKKKFFKNLEVKPPPKVIHYDLEKVRQYIDKKKTERVQNRQNEKQSKNKEILQKKRRLEELYQKQKQSVAASIKHHDHCISNQDTELKSHDSDKENIVGGISSLDFIDSNQVMYDDVNLGISEEQFNFPAHNVRVERNDNMIAGTSEELIELHELSKPLESNTFISDLAKFKIASNHVESSREIAKATEIRAFAERLQSNIEEKYKYITKFCQQASKSSSNDKHYGDVFDQDNTLPGVEDLKNHLKKVKKLNLKNNAATKIQSRWRGYNVRKTINLKKKIKNQDQEDSLSEGSLHSDDEVFNFSPVNNILKSDQSQLQQNNFEMNNSNVDAFDSDAATDSSKPDPYNFINTLAKKNLVFIGPLSKGNTTNIDDRFKTTEFSSGNKAISYESDFNSFSQISSSHSKKSDHKTDNQTSMHEDLTTSHDHKDIQISSVTDFDSPSTNTFPSTSDKISFGQTEESVGEEIKHNLSSVTLSEGSLSSSEIHEAVSIASESEESFVSNKLNSVASKSELSSVSTQIKSVPTEIVKTDTLMNTVSSVKSSISSSHTSSTDATKISRSKTLSGEVDIYSSTQATRSSVQSGLSAEALRAHMQSELNHLDILDESLQKVKDLNKLQKSFQVENKTAQAIEYLQRSERKHQEEVSKFLNQISEERIKVENQLKKRLLDHDQCLKSATQSIAQVRQETYQLIQKDAKKLISTQVEATKKEAEVLNVMNSKGMERSKDSITGSSNSESDVNHSESAKSFVSSDQQGKHFDSHSVVSSISSATDVDEQSKTKTSIPTEEFFQTTTQITTPSVIVTEQLSVVEESNPSIPEDISERESDKYSLSFEEESVTEEEEEKQETYHKLMLPSLRHQRSDGKSSHNTSGTQSDLDTSTNSSIGEALSTSSQPKLSNSSRSSFVVERNSFEKFTLDMVKQYMKEGELRTHHQRALLKLREKAVVEKTKAELTWLELQKKKLKQTGSDDQMPPIRKKQRGLLLRLQQEQAEIKRMKSIQKAAEQERQMLFQQQEDIYKLHKSTKQVMDKIKLSSLVGSPLKSLSQLSLASSVRTNRSKLPKMNISPSATQLSSSPEMIATEDNTSITGGNESIPDIDSNTPKSANSGSKSITDAKSKESESHQSFVSILKDLKALEASKRNLSKRERKLSERKQTVEEIIQWHKKLDIEEAEIRVKEKEILERFELEKRKRYKEQTSSSEGDNKFQTSMVDTFSKSLLEQRKSTGASSEIRTMSVSEDGKDDQSVIEAIETVENEAISDEKSFTDSISEDVKTPKTESISYVKMASSNKTHTSDYTESFETESKRTEISTSTKQKETVTTQSSDHSTSHSRLMVSIKSPLSPRSCHTHRRHDSSGSEDSFTVSLSETASDQSDVEGRILALKDELRRRKANAERLKREQKRINHDRLRAQETSLKKQLEAYDKFINEAKQDLEIGLELDLHQLQKTAVKPQIKQPESRRLKRQLEVGSSGSSSDVASPPIISDKSSCYFKSQGSESESGKSSSGHDEIKEEVSNDSASKEPELHTDGLENTFISTVNDQSSHGATNDNSNCSNSSVSTSIIEEVEHISEENNIDNNSVDLSEINFEGDQIISEINSNKVQNRTVDLVCASEPLCEYSEIFESSITISESIEYDEAKSKDLSKLGDEFTDELMDQILFESFDVISLIKNKPHAQQHSSVISDFQTDPIQTAATNIADNMVAQLLSEALSCILSIRSKHQEDILSIHEKQSISNSSDVSKRVSTIMSEIQEKQSSSPRDRHRPQDLMMLSPILNLDSDDILPSENFPFTDAFKEDEQVSNFIIYVQ
ncbi:Centrosome-associated protein 350 [Nymphon striatum]|nr:Centrosome-associated protein 350 [Nymphon striatum]